MKKIYLNELSKLLNINESALRYYDSKGVLPKTQRDENNYRFIYEDDLGYARTVICLKKTDMSLRDIKKYLDYAEKGDSTLEVRYQMILRQENLVLKKLKDLQEQKDFIDYKKGFYLDKLKNN